LRSTQQLSQVLFDEMKLPHARAEEDRFRPLQHSRRRAGGAGAYGDELSSAQRRAIEIILEHRQLEKLRGTYVDALPALVNPQTGGCTPASARPAP
jgi:DNA polymerase-1